MRKFLLLVVVVLLISSFSTNAFGQKLGLKAIAPQIGIIFPEDPYSTGFNLGAVANLGEFYENIGFYPGLLYWYAGGDYSGVDVSFSNFQITLDVHYKTKEFKGFFAGLAPSINFLSFKIDLPEYVPFVGGSTSASDTKVGIGFFVGYETQIEKHTAYAKAKFDIISDFNTFKIDLGYYFDIGK
jgi:hypothetical protein